MRVLVVSDVHANHEALRAVTEAETEEPDAVLCLGDLVDYGPDPVPCVAWARANAAATVRGNHDDALARGIRCRCAASVQPLSDATQDLARRALGPEDVAWLGTLPLEARVTIGGVRFLLVHATPQDPLFTYLRPDERPAWERAVEGVDADVVLVGHTHLPMALKIGTLLVVNPGSVGQPRDGDPRAAYAVVEDGRPVLRRASYDVEATVRSLGAQTLAPDIVQGLAGILRSGGAGAGSPSGGAA